MYLSPKRMNTLCSQHYPRKLSVSLTGQKEGIGHLNNRPLTLKIDVTVNILRSTEKVVDKAMCID